MCFSTGLRKAMNPSDAFDDSLPEAFYVVLHIGHWPSASAEQSGSQKDRGVSAGSVGEGEAGEERGVGSQDSIW